MRPGTVQTTEPQKVNRKRFRPAEAGILLNGHVAEDGPTVFAHACRLGAEGIVSKRVDGTCRSGPCPVWIKVRVRPASRCSGSEVRIGIGDPGWLVSPPQERRDDL